jgi:hypothetical protein
VAKDLMFQDEITESVRRAYSATCPRKLTRDTPPTGPNEWQVSDHRYSGRLDGEGAHPRRR